MKTLLSLLPRQPSNLLSAVSASRSAFGQDIEAESDTGLLSNPRAASAEFDASSPGRARRNLGKIRVNDVDTVVLTISVGC